MGQKERARILLDKYLKNKGSKAETDRVDQWYNTYEKQPVRLNNEKRERLRTEIYGHIEKNISSKPKPTVYRLLKPVLQIAAVLLIVSSITFLFLKNRGTDSGSDIRHVVMTGQTEKRRILLGDGTEVWLQPATTFAYTGNLTSSERNVELIRGDAFFQVHHDTKRPFRVKMPENMYTQVLGTSFLISSGQQAAAISVSVKSGKVAVGRLGKVLGLFTAGQQLTYHKARQIVETGTIKNGSIKELKFDHTTLAELAAKLEWAYYVRIEVPKDPKIIRLQYTGTFDTGQEVGEVLKTVCLLHQLKLIYQPNQHTYSITKL